MVGLSGQAGVGIGSGIPGILLDADRNVPFPREARMCNPGGEVTGGDFNAVVQVDFTSQQATEGL